MTQFLSDIAGVLELLTIAAGLLLLHRAATETAGPRWYLKVAGLVLVVGGIGLGVCSMSYWLKYQGQGDFDRASLTECTHADMPTHTQMMHGPGGMGPHAHRGGTPHGG